MFWTSVAIVGGILAVLAAIWAIGRIRRKSEPSEDSVFDDEDRPRFNIPWREVLDIFSYFGRS